MDKHTPGPWTVSYVNMEQGEFSILECLQGEIDARSNGSVVCEANAAAPDLLETLEGTCSFLQGGNSTDPRTSQMIDLIRKVVAKAKGGAQ